MPGSLVTPLHGTTHMYLSIDIHLGEYVAPFYFGDFGIVIESGDSEWGVRYLKVLLPDGKIGWVRGEKVEPL